MLMWHTQQPVNGKSPEDATYNFFKVILDAELDISLTPKYLAVFRNEPGLRIKHEMLTNDERELLGRVYVKRDTYFDTVQRFQDGSWLASGCKCKLEERYRKELLRDFVHYSISKKPMMRVVLIDVTQRLIGGGKRDDEFLRNLHDKLQGIGNINNLLVIYD